MVNNLKNSKRIKNNSKLIKTKVNIYRSFVTNVNLVDILFSIACSRLKEEAKNEAA